MQCNNEACLKQKILPPCDDACIHCNGEAIVLFKTEVLFNDILLTSCFNNCALVLSKPLTSLILLACKWLQSQFNLIGS